MKLDEISTSALGKYKTAATKDAQDADKKGDTQRANKRFSGVVKATNKQFKNDSKSSNIEENGMPMSFVEMKNNLKNARQSISRALVGHNEKQIMVHLETAIKVLMDLRQDILNKDLK